jgi:Cu+-exporting ATPase
LLVGTGRGAQLGIVISGPEALESARHIDTIVLDKTGTVTEGRMTVVAVIAGGEATQADVIMAAGAAESGSEHPIAKAITEYARARGSSPPSASFKHPGLSMRAELSVGGAGATTNADKSVIVRRLELMETEGLRVAELRTACGATGTGAYGGARRLGRRSARDDAVADVMAGVCRAVRRLRALSLTGATDW